MNETNGNGMAKFLVPGSVVVAGLLIAGAVMWNNQHPAAVGNAGTKPAAATANIKDVKIAGEPFIGNANAPVTIAYWSDYQCPFCKRFETDTLPQIVQNYVDKGKVKIVFKDFAFLGKDSITGGEYARSVWKLYPDQYFKWRTAMFNAQDQEGDQGFGNEATVQALTKTIAGIDEAKVAADVAASRATYDAAMNADRSEGQTLGVSATPSFILGTQLIAGAYPYANFQSAIDTALK